MGRKKAIILPSSGEVLYQCDSDFFTPTLVSLLKEGWDKKLKDKERVSITYRTLPRNFSGDFPDESDLIFRQGTISYKELKVSYEKGFNEEYSPEIEEERHSWELEAMIKDGARRTAWGAYSQTMKILDAIEESREEQKLIRKGDKEGLNKLKEKQAERKRNNRLQIA
jgi:hypothetical protein